MTPKSFLQVGLAVVLLAVSTGCSSLASPFDKMKDSQMTVYRLQNFEPPPQTATVPGTAPSPVALPPQIQQWISGAAQLLPPGLLPPGLIPGAATPAAVPDQQIPRFHDFRILGYQQINDSDLKTEIVETFGKEGNFSDQAGNCMYAEFGFAIAQPSGGPPADILVSLSCNQVKAYNFQWPYSKQGLTPDTQKKIASIVQKTFRTN